MHADEPADLVHEVFTAALFPGSPARAGGPGRRGDHRRPCPGTQIAGFHGHHYRPGNMVVAAAGDLDHDKVVAGIDRRFAGRGRRVPLRPDGPASAPPRRLAVVPRPTEQAHVVVGVPGPRPRRRRPLRAGRPQPRARRRDVEPAVPGDPGEARAGLLGVLVPGVVPGDGRAGGVRRHLAGPGSRGARPDRRRARPHAEPTASTERELAMAKGHLQGSMALALEDSGARMSRLGRSQLVHGRVPTLDESGQPPRRGHAWPMWPTSPDGCWPDRGPSPSSARSPRTSWPTWPSNYAAAMRVGVFGAGGRMGATVCRAVAADPALELVAAVDPHHAGLDLRQVAGVEVPGVQVEATADALARAGRGGGGRLHRAGRGPGQSAVVRRARRARRGRHDRLLRGRPRRAAPAASRRGAGPTASWRPTSPSGRCS